MNNVELTEFNGWKNSIAYGFSNFIEQYFVMGLLLLLCIVILLLVIDYLFRNNYKMKLKVRTKANQIGTGEEMYQNYWLWQRSKKRLIVGYFQKDNQIYYTRHARKKRYYKRSLVPFRKEVYIVL